MSIPSSARPGVIVLFIGTLVGLVAALYGYFAPLTGVNGTLGALLAIVVSVVLLLLANTFIEPVNIENIYACLGMFLLAWLSGCCIGLVFRAIQPWWPKGIAMVSMLYRRLNMISSGKMFVANVLPSSMVAMFSWNPLFHVIDQTRGFAFINYTPHNSSVIYPIYFSLAVAMIGLMGEFVTRNSQSLSWTAGR